MGGLGGFGDPGGNLQTPRLKEGGKSATNARGRRQEKFGTAGFQARKGLQSHVGAVIPGAGRVQTGQKTEKRSKLGFLGQNWGFGVKNGVLRHFPLKCRFWGIFTTNAKGKTRKIDFWGSKPVFWRRFFGGLGGQN